ncbi:MULTISPECIES: carbon-nitrogen hydrolase [Thiorhodovibrio]|uniref:carbon-nitrogen hydrolase n=1 Tax=Thiorhodovibrio TaxID=61593 RepID=UPI001A933F08|nr:MULTISPECIES: carbon-nitrogen hydrolase [Thiorhodovibrio]MBK5968732.1 acyltransferase [Thiorhodovibrio winogradskyi]WPL10912.1 N-carbamoyl-D-amino acid hydrolase [Thiorhodovibrio litoralis]
MQSNPDRARVIKLALAQDRDHGDAETNRRAILDHIEAAAQAGCGLLLLQELHNGPYFCQRESMTGFDRAEPVPGPTTEWLGVAARRHGLVIVGSLFERRAPGLYHNTAVVLDTDGRLAGCYRKMHIPDDPGYYEKYYFTSGDLGFNPIDTSIGRLGVLVCWDQWFPEAARLMALAGAELLLYPTAIGWDPEDSPAEQARQREAWMTVQRGHAIANGLPLLACNRVGFEAEASAPGGGSQFWGSSFVCGPQGELLARAPEDAPALLIAEIDLSHSEQIRRAWPFLRDRRIDAYGDLSRRFRDSA